MPNLLPPCSYQGGKQRVAKEIVDYIISNELIYPSTNGTKFYDLCCGSGAITIELINRGMSPTNITMCDASSWGKFWKTIGEGTFSLERFKWWCDQAPKDKFQIKGFMEELSKSDALEDEEYKYLLLQSASFGGKQIWREGHKWKNTSFRSYWQPTKTSKRQSPVNPTQPSIEVIYGRVTKLVDTCYGINVINNDIETVFPIIENDGAIYRVIYIDPPYEDTTKYGFNFNLIDTLSELFNHTLSPIYVSEYKPLNDECIRLNFNGKKGGISGGKTKVNEEWLSVFR